MGRPEVDYVLWEEAQTYCDDHPGVSEEEGLRIVRLQRQVNGRLPKPVDYTPTTRPIDEATLTRGVGL